MIYNFDIQLKDNFYKLDIEGIFTYKKNSLKTKLNLRICSKSVTKFFKRNFLRNSCRVVKCVPRRLPPRSELR